MAPSPRGRGVLTPAIRFVFALLGVVAAYQVADRLRQTDVLELSPFYLSARKSYHALDVGFSIDKVKGMKIRHASAVEFLAFVGLQRFRPIRNDGQLRFGVWNTPLQVALAAAVAVTLMQPLCSEVIEFEIINRDERGHKQFSSARRRQHV